ncbi:MAG: substrate-binding domain-containing protein [Sulfobacillus sp.]
MPMVPIGQKILNLRQQRHWSQQQLADKVGISRQSLIAIEHDRSRIHLDLAAALADAFSIGLDELTDRMPQPSVSQAKQVFLLGQEPIASTPVVWSEIGDCLVLVPTYFTLDNQVVDAWWDAATGSLEPMQSGRLPRQVILAAGCDPQLGWLKTAMESQDTAYHLELVSASSRRALAWLQAGQVHLAGSHWLNPRTQRYNDWSQPLAKPVLRIGYVKWAEGALWRPESTEPPRQWAVRETGSEAHAVFERHKHTLVFPNPGPIFDRHLDLVRYVHDHPGVGGVSLGSLAAWFGLAFQPWTEESYQWLVDRNMVEDPWFKALIGVLQHTPLKEWMARVPYQTLDHWGQVT